MDKYKYQILVLCIAMIIGALGGFFLSSSQKNKEIKKLVELHRNELIRQNIELTKSISKREITIEKQDSIRKQDSVLISNLTYKIKKDGVKVDQERKQVLNLSNNEKRKWIIDKYTN